MEFRAFVGEPARPCGERQIGGYQTRLAIARQVARGRVRAPGIHGLEGEFAVAAIPGSGASLLDPWAPNIEPGLPGSARPRAGLQPRAPDPRLWLMQPPDPRAGLRPAPEPLASDARTWIAPLTEAAGPSFRALYLYGSALASDFEPALGNVNLLFVVEDLAFARLEPLAAAVLKVRGAKPGKWRYAPLILEAEQVKSAADVFPNDFLDLVRRRALLAGEDLLASAEISPDHMRYQCEYELRTRLIALRQAYLFNAGSATSSQELLAGAAEGSSSLYRHLLSLAGRDPVERREELARVVAEVYGVDAEALRAPYIARSGGFKKPGVSAHLGAYLDALTTLARAVDAYAHH